MTNGPDPKSREDHRVGTIRLGLAWKVALAALVVVIALFLFRGEGEARRDRATFVARRGPLEVVVLEGGTIEALQYREYKHRVRIGRGRSGLKILSLVEEGYQVTEEDVRQGKVLVTLDDTDLQDILVEEQSALQDDISDLTQARQQYRIQVKQNESDIQAANLQAKFARMDFEKYLGTRVTGGIIGLLDAAGVLGPDVEMNQEVPAQSESRSKGTQNSLGMSDRLAATVREIVGEEEEDENDEEGSREGRRRGRDSGDEGDGDREGTRSRDRESDGDRPREGRGEGRRASGGDERAGEKRKARQKEPEEAIPEYKLPDIDFTKYAKRELLGSGEAQQTLRTLEDRLVLAQAELALAEDQLEGTQRLAEQGFVTKSDLEKDLMAVKRGLIRLASAETAERLFITYEFPKNAEKLAADFVQARRNLRRAKEQASALLLMSESRLMAEQRQYELRKAEKDRIQSFIDDCTIRAEDVGTVVYGSSVGYWEPDEERIKEGADVRRRRRIISIPDTVNMGVRMKVHESAIRKLALGQKARVRVDAYPDRVLQGEVVKFDVLPDPGERIYNPDVKVYATSLRIEGVHDWLKTGMTAQLEVTVGSLESVIYVPIQAIARSGDDRVCYVVRGDRVERRVVEAGEFTDTFIEIRSGLEEGEEVLLQAPEEFEYLVGSVAHGTAGPAVEAKT